MPQGADTPLRAHGTEKDRDSGQKKASAGNPAEAVHFRCPYGYFSPAVPWKPTEITS